MDKKFMRTASNCIKENFKETIVLESIMLILKREPAKKQMNPSQKLLMVVIRAQENSVFCRPLPTTKGSDRIIFMILERLPLFDTIELCHGIST